MATFNADEIIGKSLIAKVSLNAYKQPTATSEIYANFKPGQTVGVVYSWVNKSGKLFWMFYDSKKNPYYVEHSEGRFSLKALADQGAKTTKQKTEEKRESEKSLGEKLGEQLMDFTGILKWILVLAIIAYLIYETGLIKKLVK